MILNLVGAFLFPLIIPVAYSLLSKVNTVPETEEKNGQLVIREQISIFYAEIPGAYLANILWGATLSVNAITNDWVQVWMTFYLIMALGQVFLIMYLKGTPRRQAYMKTLYWLGSILLLASLVRIFFVVCSDLTGST